MTIRIPATLNWLAKKRKYIGGQIVASEKQHQKKVAEFKKELELITSAHEHHIRILRIDLDAIDRALRMPASICADRF